MRGVSRRHFLGLTGSAAVAAISGGANAAMGPNDKFDLVIKRGGYHGYHHGYGARAEYREHRDRGWHRGWRHGHRDKVVIIKKHRY